MEMYAFGIFFFPDPQDRIF